MHAHFKHAAAIALSFDFGALHIAGEPMGSPCFDITPGSGRILGDVNGDGAVDVDDLLAIILGWGACASPPSPCHADLNHNSAVNVDDLLIVIVNWS